MNRHFSVVCSAPIIILVVSLMLSYGMTGSTIDRFQIRIRMKQKGKGYDFGIDIPSTPGAPNMCLEKIVYVIT